MCGIVGAVGLVEQPDPALTQRLLDGMGHRGPDAEDELWRDGVWLGFRRLAILDLDARGNQPMVDDESGTAIVFNGEIYDYVELRARLTTLGHRFRTTGDTEVLLRGFLEWGTDVFGMVNGMFAVAVHDPRTRSVVLARDRFGEKPLHLGRHRDGSWWFASELGTLIDAGVGSRRLDAARAMGFLALGDIEDPAGSLVDGIEQLPPASVTTLTPDGPVQTRRWWHLDDVLDRARDLGPAGDEEVIEALDRSVALRLRSDVTVGTSLSGGVDSSAIVASMRADDADRVIHTFTASFPGSPIDEWDRAAKVGEHLGLTMHRVEPTMEDFVDDLDALVRHQGGPIESPTVYAQWCVMRAARAAGVTVLLDGQGADETWGGYPKYVWMGAADLVRRGQLPAAVRMARTWRRLGGLPSPPVSQTAALSVPASLRPAVLAVARRRGDRSFGPALRNVALRDPQGTPGRGPLLTRAARADVGRVLLPRLLRYADRNSMAWSRELRLPFLDPAVVLVALRSGWLDGLRDGWTKQQLRRSVAPRLPDGFVWQREKVAYQVPDDVWLAHPSIAAAVEEAHRHLVELGLLATGAAVDPWRALSLARFTQIHEVRP